MLIHEAIAATGKGARFIRRKSWSYITQPPCDGSAMKLMPTDSPDGFVIHSVARSTPVAGWQPKREDLLATDWEPVR